MGVDFPHDLLRRDVELDIPDHGGDSRWASGRLGLTGSRRREDRESGLWAKGRELAKEVGMDVGVGALDDD